MRAVRDRLVHWRLWFPLVAASALLGGLGGCPGGLLATLPLNPGTYTGQATVNMVVQAGSARDSASQLSDINVTVDDAGMPLSEGVAPTVGLTQTSTLGGMTMTVTIRSVAVTDNGVTTTSDASVVYQGEMLTGYGTDTYTKSGDNSLQYSGSVSLADASNTIYLNLSVTGTLTK